MSTREPKGEAILAARIQRAYPALNPYQSASLARDLCAIERAQRRHAERCCNGEDSGYVKVGRREHSFLDPHDPRATVIEHDPVAEERAERAIGRRMLFWHSHLLEHANYSGGVLYHADDANKTSFANPGDVAMRTEGHRGTHRPARTGASVGQVLRRVRQHANGGTRSGRALPMPRRWRRTMPSARRRVVSSRALP